MTIRDFIGAFIITYAMLGAPCYNYSILYPQTPLELLRPLHWEFKVYRMSGSVFRGLGFRIGFRGIEFKVFRVVEFRS